MSGVWSGSGLVSGSGSGSGVSSLAVWSRQSGLGSSMMQAKGRAAVVWRQRRSRGSSTVLATD